MTKFKKVLIVVCCCLLVISSGAVGIYHFYIKPEYIEPALVTAKQVLSDKDIQNGMEQIAEEMAAQGLISEELLNSYRQQIKSDNSTATKDEKAQNQDQTPQPYSAENAVGAKNVKVQSEGETSHSYAKSSSSRTPENVSNSQSDVDAATLYDKIKSRVDAADWTKIYAIYSKLNIGYISSIATDREKLKQYLHSSLSDDEYKTAMEMYLKYSYIITEP